MAPWKQVGNEEPRGAAVAQPAAVTSTVAAGVNPTKAEFDALRADVIALRTQVVALLTALKDNNTVD